VAAVATKRFFEGIQAARAEIFKSLHERFLPEDEIAAQISEAVRTILADYRANNNKLRPDFIENVLAQFPVATAGAEATSSGTTSSGTTSSATTQTPAATGDNNEHQTTAVVTEIQDQPGSTDEVPTGSGEEHLSENPEDSEGTNQEDPGLDAFQLMKADVFSQLTNLGQAVNEAADLEQFKTVALDLFEFSIVLCGQFMVPDELQEALQGLVHSG
ncbi:MAG: hypothetical protein ABSH41_31290, partial [Syntrophobacteraceae bacterium]